MAQNPQYAAGDVNNEGNTGAVNAPGTYRDPLSGVKETATTEAGADALVRLGWVKQEKDDHVVSNRDQIIKALDLDANAVQFRGDNGDQSGNSSQETIDEARRVAAEEQNNSANANKKEGK